MRKALDSMKKVVPGTDSARDAGPLLPHLYRPRSNGPIRGMGGAHQFRRGRQKAQWREQVTPLRQRQDIRHNQGLPCPRFHPRRNGIRRRGIYFASLALIVRSSVSAFTGFWKTPSSPSSRYPVDTFNGFPIELSKSTGI